MFLKSKKKTCCCFRIAVYRSGNDQLFNCNTCILHSNTDFFNSTQNNLRLNSKKIAILKLTENIIFLVTGLNGFPFLTTVTLRKIKLIPDRIRVIKCTPEQIMLFYLTYILKAVKGIILIFCS